MAYEYEGDVTSELRYLSMQYETNEFYNMADEVEKVYRKARAFDEVKQYALSKHDEFEHRKELAGYEEFKYYAALQIANKAIVNKCKQLEDNK